MKLILALSVLSLSTAAGAETFQDLAAVERAVVIAAGADIGDPGGPVAPVDRRLKLAQCPKLAVDPVWMNALTVRCPAIGWRLRVPLSPGGRPTETAAMAASTPTAMQAVSYRPAPRAEPVIRRGDPVDLIAGSDSFQVSTAAVAQEDGAPGGRIRVKTDGKAGIILAEVVGEGRVRISGFN
ncbi:MAG TPA: flagella basal body P-ring formation protein FlgA [Sphingomonas sp.]|jgi:flagella basal body P-ring formation protein FlgA|uniref:flagella basal body P-ring formation protein FlgA n=1 Tax=Sphingomonas sp. TaxID=28214 RepID=UPI002EDACD08